MRRIGVLILVGSAALLAAAAWRFDVAGRTYYSDGASIREPAGVAPVREVLWTPPAPFPLNTTDDEYEPRVSADGQLLFFVRGRAGRNADLFTCRAIPGGWSEAEPVLGVNTGADELCPQPSADGGALYFASNREGGVGGYDLWVSSRDGDSWSAPENLGPLNSPDNEYSPALTPDGKTLYFSSNRARAGEEAGERPASWSATVRENIAGRDFDLYCAALDGEITGEPEAVEALNSPSNEGTPAVSPAGDFLYFSSDRAGGLGGFDLYRARLRAGATASAENLKAPVNGPWNELDPTLSTGGFLLTFSSDRDAGEGEQGPRDYDLLASVSREVYRVTEPGSVDRWASMWHKAAPWLMWFLLSLLCVLLFLLLWRAQRNRHLNLLTRCLIGSALVHLLILFLLSLWGVTTSLGQLFHKPGGARVRLASTGSGDALAMQVRGTTGLLPPTISIAPPAEAPLMPALTRAQPVETGAARSEPGLVLLGHAATTPEAAPPSGTPEAASEPVLSHQTPDVAAPADAAPESGSEPAAKVAFDQPATPDPRAPTSGTRTDTGPIVARSEPASAGGLSDSGAPVDSGSPVTPPARTAEIRSASDSSDLATPHEAEASGVGEPVTGAVLAFGPLAEPGPEIQTGASRAEGPAPARSTPSAPGSLVEEAEAGLASPTSPSVTASSIAAHAELAPAESGLQVALPDARPEAGKAGREAEPGVDSAAADDGRPQDPNVPVARSGSGAAGPAAPRSTVDAGLSLASGREPGEAESTPSAAGANTPASTLSPTDTPAFDLALPSESAPAQTAGAMAPERSGDRVTTADAMEPAPTIAGGAGGQSGPAAARSEVDSGASLAARREPELVAPEAHRPESAAIAGVLGPTDAAATDLALPQEVAPPEDQFAQRDPENRLGLVERLGGSKETEAAVARSLEWLAAHQSADGRWSSSGFDDECRRCGGTTRIESDRAVTGLALLCFLASDHTHTREGPYREAVGRAVAWLRGEQRADGDLRAGETMYSHGIATIALAEAFAMTKDRDLADPVARAAAFIASARNSSDGGWRYEPGEPGDTSVLGWQVMALTSARRAGVEVPEESLAAADRWLDAVSARSPGLYAYQPGMQPTHSMTAEGLYVRQLLGHGRDEEIMLASVERVLRTPPRWDRQPSTYAWYYATLALFQHGGPEWDQWNGKITEVLLANQRTDGPAAGSWDPVDRWAVIGGRVYQTAICTLTLEVYYRYLPMYAVEGRGPSPAPAGGTQPSP